MRDWPVHLTAGALVAAVLGPLAAPGYALSYDMVFVPAQHLGWDLIAPASALPRAVPLDAAVALANLVVPGWLLQRLALAALVYLAAVGAAQLVPTNRVVIRLVAAVGYGWTPYLAERLLIGHWALLCAYAALPWLVLASIALRAGDGRALPRLVLAAAAGCLTPTGGVITLICVAVLVWGAARRLAWLAVGAVAALNLPWLAAAATSTAGGRSDPSAVAAFAARGENWSGPVWALAGSGGIWNRLTTPASRSSALIPLVTLLLLALAVAGWPLLRSRLPAGVAARLGWLAAGGFVLALAGVSVGAPVLRFLVVHVPGAGLLRDGQKFLIPYALMFVLCLACGAERIGERLPAEACVLVAVATLVVPVASMPDLAWGGAGALRPVAYPRDWAAVSRLVAGSDGELLSLPFSEYQVYPWNHDRVVIDPAPRYFDTPVISDDTLVVGGQAIEGEDPRAAAIRQRLAAGLPLAPTGITWLLVQRPGVPPSALAGLDPVYQGDSLALYRNPAGQPAPVASPGRRALMTGAYLAALTVTLAAAGGSIRRRRTIR